MLKKFIIIWLFAFVILLAILIPGIKVVFGIIGSSSSNILLFIMPSAMFIKAIEMEIKEA